MNKTTYLVFIAILFFNYVKAQVLWSDNFDSYPIGLLSTDSTGIKPGYGKWHVTTSYYEVKIVPESGKGNVMAIGWSKLSGSFSTFTSVRQENIDVLWNSRNKKNNIFKLEFEIIGEKKTSTANGYFIHEVFISEKNAPYDYRFSCYSGVMGAKIGAGDQSVPYKNNWIKVEMIIDYNTNTLYYYVPNQLFIQDTRTTIDTPYKIISKTYFNGYDTPSNSSLKYDNFKISAIDKLPDYLRVNEVLAKHFKLYPNPAVNVVNIHGSENLFVDKVEVYDFSGKFISSHDFSNESEIQLNVEALTSGTYLLHLKTNEGIAVKKLIKK